MGKKRLPWTCNFCGGKLWFVAQFTVSPEIVSAINAELKSFPSKVIPFEPRTWKVLTPIPLKEDDVFKLQVCDNPECGRKFIFIDNDVEKAVIRSVKEWLEQKRKKEP